MSKKSSGEELELGNMLPREINSWKVKEDRIYDPDTIFRYLNGSSEIYRAYDFKLLFARHYERSGQPTIIADLFDMATDSNAYGIFSHGNEGYDAGIGQGSNYMGGLLSFWKGRFFVSLFAEQETEEAKETLYKLARAAASSIKKNGQIPEIVSLLPAEGLDMARIRYFHDHIILNYHFFVADDNILNLDQRTDAALGVYHEEGTDCHLLLVRYPKASEAARALESFVSAYMPDAVEPGLIQTEDGKWTAAWLADDLLIIVFDALSKAHALQKGAHIP